MDVGTCGLSGFEVVNLEVSRQRDPRAERGWLKGSYKDGVVEWSGG